MEESHGNKDVMEMRSNSFKINENIIPFQYHYEETTSKNRNIVYNNNNINNIIINNNNNNNI